MFKTFAFAATALTLAAGSAFAAPSDDARTHFQAIASGDTQIVMRAYADQAQLNWVGGPLDGTYATTDAIRGTWEKFGKAVGPLKLTIGSIEESANPKGSTVSANVVFEGRMRDRFHSDPVIKAAELLLQEKAPRSIPVSTVRTDADEQIADRNGLRRKDAHYGQDVCFR